MTTNQTTAAPCETCPVHNAAALKKLGVDMTDFDFVVALAGNPNTGKSTVFNALTGLRQHTGNWPGKTVTRAEGGFEYGEHKYQAGGFARDVFPPGNQPRRGSGARFHPVRPTRCDHSGCGCHPTWNVT